MPQGTDDAHVIKGATLADLEQGIGERLAAIRARHRRTEAGAGLRERRSTATIQRFNGFAASGQGSRLPARRASGRAAVQRRRSRRKPSAPNPTMFPICGGGTLLRGAADRRQPRHQGRPEDQRLRPGARRSGQADCRASTASAIASPRPRRAPIGPAARRSGRSWRSLTWRPQRTQANEEARQ